MIKRVFPTSRQFDRLEKYVKYDFDGANTAVQSAWQNDEGRPVIVTRAILVVTTVASGADTIDVGITATSATTSADSLLDGVDGTTTAPAVTDSADAGLDTGANDLAQYMAEGSWVTFDPQKTGDSAGLKGTLFIGYIVL